MEGEGGGQVQTTVCDIPMELWLDIVVPLESQDVLSLQSTCRYLRYILNTRDIWAMALRQMCKKRAVFLPSFPVNDMDLPRLKRASLSPYRFTKLLESNSHHSADLPSIIPEKSTKVDIGRPDECEQSFLVPGGRFLIVARQFAVDLWDFGPPDCPALQTPICLATRPAEPDLYPYPRPAASTTLMAVRMVREDTIRVAVATGAIAVRLFEIRPGDPNPGFKVLGTFLLDIPAKPVSIFLSDDVVFVNVHQGRHSGILVWHPKGRWYALGPNRRAIDASRALRKAVVSNDKIIEFGQSRPAILIWSFRREDMNTYPATEGKIVTYLPLAIPSSATSVPTVETVSLPDDHKLHNHFDVVHYSGSWSAVNEPIVFEVLFWAPPGMYESKTVYGYRYKMDVDGAPDGSSSKTEFSLITTFTLPPVQAPGGYSIECEAPGRMVEGFGSGAVLRLERRQRRGFSLYSPMSPNPSPSTSPTPEPARLACLQARDSHCQRVCVATGRFFWSDWRAPRDIGVSYVCDFLSSWNEKILD